jgi:hypothetical protein
MSLLDNGSTPRTRSLISAGEVSPPDGEPWMGLVLPAAPVLFILSFCGMATGLAIDLKTVLPATLASLCLGPHSLLDGVVAHTSLLPATNLLTLGSGFVAIGLIAGATRRPEDGRSGRGQIAFYAICNLVMLAGMLLGAALGPRLVAPLGLPWSAGAMLTAMAIGMAAGMGTATVSARVLGAGFRSRR